MQRHFDLTANDIIRDSRLVHVRELKAEVARLKAELAVARSCCAEWESHFSLALAAACDADRIGTGNAIVVIDGWNVVLNSGFKGEGDAHLGKQRLMDAARAFAQAHPGTFVWLVFDGDDENAECGGSFRVSYTGGTGEHRADRLVVDYVRMMRLTGRTARLKVITNDKDFGKKVRDLGADVASVKEFVDGL